MKYKTSMAFALITVLSLTGCAPFSERSTQPAPAVTQEQPQEITVTTYLPDENYLKLKAKKITMPRTDTLEKDTLTAMIAADQKQKYPLLPKNLTIRDVKIENHIATVDLSKDILSMEKGTTTEELFIAMVTNTLTERKDIDGVKFLVEGKEITHLTGHQDMTQTFRRNTNIIQ